MDIKETLKSYYHLKNVKLEILDGGYRNQCYKVICERGEYVFIIYKREADTLKTIRAAHMVANELYKKGFPSRVPIQTNTSRNIIRIKRQDGFHNGALYPFLSGTTIPWEAYTRRHLKSMGKVISDMHYTLKPFKNLKCKIKNWSDFTESEIKRMQVYLKGVETWIEKKLHVSLNWKFIKKVFKEIITQTKSYPHNILHYDFVRGNILFSHRLDKHIDIYPITGIIDFEKVCFGPEIADIARTLAFLIVDCKYKSERMVRKRFLFSGYEKRGKNALSFSEKQQEVLEQLLNFFWLRDFWKFLVHNPYEDLYLNEHYLRTRDKLTQRKLLDSLSS